MGLNPHSLCLMEHRTERGEEISAIPNIEGAPTFSPSLPPGLRVLVVDDDDNDRDLTIRCFEKAWPADVRVIVDKASDGVEALELLGRERYVLLILDWRLHRLDGAAVVKGMQEMKIWVPLMVISGEAREDVLLDWQPLGAAFISKNELNPELLRQAIRKVMFLPVESGSGEVR